jgi:hypothetical protein
MLQNASPKKLSFRDIRQMMHCTRRSSHCCIAVTRTTHVAEDRLETTMRWAESYVDRIQSVYFEEPRLGYPAVIVRFRVSSYTALVPQQQLLHLH